MMVRVISVLLLLLIGACSDKPEAIVELQGSTMGTSYHVKLSGLPESMAANILHKDIDLLLETVNLSMSTYRDESEISQFNRQAIGQWLHVSPGFINVTRFAKSLCEITDGAYDPTVGALVDLWGFGPAGAPHGMPDENAVRAAKARTGCRYIEFDESKSSVRRTANIQLDLSSAAKGYAVDVVVNYLKVLQIDAFMVEIGGELYAKGRKPAGDPWRVGIEKPEPEQRSLMQVIPIENRGIATSGDYRNYVEFDGQRYTHIIDPVSGHPIAREIISASVLHDSVMQADGWATALMVAGEERSRSLSEIYGLDVYLIIADPVGPVREYTHGAFADLLSGDYSPLQENAGDSAP